MASFFRAALAALSFTLLAAAPAEPLFVPALRENFPDPFIIEHQGEFLAYATNNDVNLPMARSRDLLTWEPVTDAKEPRRRLDAMPVLGAWATKGRTWAPEVIKAGGKWVLHYTARHARKNVQCIGVATAADPRGPFRDERKEPLVCQTELGGTIDANAFRDADGQLYLYYKNDGNAVRKLTEIWAQRLTPEGTALVGSPVSLGLRNDKPWEAHVIEAPTMVRRTGGYTMLYSAHHFGWEPDQRLSAYAMGYATCQSPMGPCTDAPENPILHSYRDAKAGCLSGPGHQSVFEAAGRQFISFHAWAATSGCRKAEDARYFYIAPLSWRDGKPVIGRSLRPKLK